MPAVPFSPDFPTTQWTLIQRLKRGSEAEVSQALDVICRDYYYPLYCFIRSTGVPTQDTSDVLHDFLEHLLDQKTLSRPDQELGRLRDYLKASLRHFLTNRHLASRAAKRGGGILHLELDSIDAETRYTREKATDSPEHLYDRKWALELLRVTLETLCDEYAAAGKKDLFAALAPALTAEGTSRGARLKEKSGILGMSEGALRVAFHRLKLRYRSILTQKVQDTLENPAQVQEEIAYLLRLFTQ